MLCFWGKKGGWKGAVIYLSISYTTGLFDKNEKCLKFYLKGLRKAVKYVILIVYGN